MAKNSNNFICQACGAVYHKWSGKCDACGQWDTISEEVTTASYSNTSSSNKGKVQQFVSLTGKAKDTPRVSTTISELDHVLGGGLVTGSAILLGGDPGIGKSTLVLQMMANLALAGKNPAYISGEESVDQIRLRAKRLGLEQTPIKLMTATSVKDIISSINKDNDTDVAVIDSIQTMFVEEISSAPGTVSQVRASAHELITFAKKKNITLLMVGHVTKEGQIAGPKILEHMVDTVLYFEGERGHQFRILRAVKNRFGPANEIGVFEMKSEGLVQIVNPSSLFVSENKVPDSGSVVYAGIEGTRPVLVEIQALVAPSFMATPRRAAVGWDANRLAMILAILQTRYGLFLGDKEVYLNIAGGLKVQEPAADLAVAAALISSAMNIPLPQQYIIFGELGLSGEVRAVPQSDVRLREAEKLGFRHGVVPLGTKFKNNPFILRTIRHIRELQQLFEKEHTLAS